MATNILSKIAQGAVGLGAGVSLLQASLYNVDGGSRAVMFDRLSGVKKRVMGEGTHFRIPWLQEPHIFDVRIRPRNIASNTGTKDLQVVTINLRVLSRPEEDFLPEIFSSLGLDYDERVLPSIGNEVSRFSPLLVKRLAIVCHPPRFDSDCEHRSSRFECTAPPHPHVASHSSLSPFGSSVPHTRQLFSPHSFFFCRTNPTSLTHGTKPKGGT